MKTRTESYLKAIDFLEKALLAVVLTAGVAYFVINITILKWVFSFAVLGICSAYILLRIAVYSISRSWIIQLARKGLPPVEEIRSLPNPWIYLDVLGYIWEKRSVKKAGRILKEAWPMNMGLTDDIAGLDEALKRIKTEAKDELTGEEFEILCFFSELAEKWFRRD